MASPSSVSSAKTEKTPSRARQTLAKGATLLASLALCGLLTEGTFQFVEWREARHSYWRGGGRNLRDDRWGWRLTTGAFEIGSPEFAVTGSINELSMNDVPFDPAGDAARTRVLALGDSHTFAVGASMQDTWPKQLERDLSALDGAHAFHVYNTGTPGYNLHQYLLRLTDQGPLVKPDYVVVGFSYATDLFDLLPPDRGGWVYGFPDQPRDYFDFDAQGVLTERHWVPSGEAAKGVKVGDTAGVYRLREFLNNFASFRYISRSSLALALGSRVHVGGRSLWPNMEVVINEQLDAQQQYQWRLAQALLLRIKAESEKQHAHLVVVGIPYLPQVYDELWKVTFAGKPGVSPTAAIDRMRAFCKESGIDYVDTLDAFKKGVAAAGHWLHYHKDAHPTVEGHTVIAKTITAAGLLKPVR